MRSRWVKPSFSSAARVLPVRDSSPPPGGSWVTGPVPGKWARRLSANPRAEARLRCARARRSRRSRLPSARPRTRDRSATAQAYPGRLAFDALTPSMLAGDGTAVDTAVARFLEALAQHETV